MPERPFEDELARERRSLGELLRRAREESGVTQQEAAQRIGLSQSAISRFEQGERGLDLAELRVILRAYGRTLQEFLGSHYLSLL